MRLEWFGTVTIPHLCGGSFVNLVLECLLILIRALPLLREPPVDECSTCAAYMLDLQSYPLPRKVAK